LQKIDSHAKITFSHTDTLLLLAKKNVKTIGVFSLYFVLACFENDVLPFALISFCMLMVVLIFTNRQRLILTEEQIFLIYRNGHQQMNIKEVLRISGSKNKMTFIDLENQLHVDMRGWEKQEVERLRTYVEQVLSISIPKNQ
ncbi:MAG: hypothetical protein AB8G22_25505, partial [Saprospiraceae bacterium]